MTVVAYFAVLAGVAVLVFMATSAVTKAERDYMIVTGLLLVEALVAVLLGLDKLGVL